MTATTDSGSIEVTADETVLKEYSVEKEHFVDFTVFLTPMQAGDSFTFRVYKKDATGGTYRLFAVDPFTGVQAIPTIYYPMMSGKFNIKLTGQKTAGTNRTFLWESVEVT